MSKGKFYLFFTISTVAGGCLFFPEIASASSVDTLGTIATHLTSSFKGIAKLITAGAYLAGGAFALGAIMKFKQHKDNPQQTPIGQPIALLFISAALLFLPTVYKSTGASVFGSGNKNSISGVSNF